MLYLASKSPQRKNLLESLGIDFEIVLPDYREDDPPGSAPSELVERHSIGKARSALPRLLPLPAGRPIIGVDTMVIFDGIPMGKPGDEDEARQYLKRLSGATHLVYSGIAIIWTDGKSDGHGGPKLLERIEFAVTEVRFSSIPLEELELYIGTGEWRERAGAYAIQERASAFVEEIRGDYTSVVGLPVPLLTSMLRDIGFWPPESWKKGRQPA